MENNFTIDSVTPENENKHSIPNPINKRAMIINVILSSIIFISLTVANFAERQCIPYLFKDCDTWCIGNCGDWGILIIGIGFILLFPAIFQIILAYLNIKIKINRWLWLFAHFPMLLTIGWYGVFMIWGVATTNWDLLAFIYLLVTLLMNVVYIYLLQAKLRKLY
jgi:hypothetical protein